MNNVQLTGNIGKDPEIRMTANGTAMARFSVAISRKYTTNDGQEKEVTDWVPVIAWGSLAEAAGNSLRKGARVHVAGRVTTRSWDGPDGKKRYATEVNASLIAIPLYTGTRTAEKSDTTAFNEFSAVRPEPYMES